MQEATYGPAAAETEARALAVDVTVPVQALVHRSQLFIPGHRAKVRASVAYSICMQPWRRGGATAMRVRRGANYNVNC